jgi:hypothetical protein
MNRRITLAALGLAGAIAVATPAVASADLAAKPKPTPQPADTATALANTGTEPRTGRFVVRCGFSHTAMDDPIVKPGQAGASHDHTFFGATTTDADTTFDSLMASTTTCNDGADHSAYWVPTLQRNGVAVKPIRSSVYYLVGGRQASTIVAPPNGLKMVAGDSAHIRFACTARNEQGRGSATMPTSCPRGTNLVTRVVFPGCWDGLNLDSPDHRSHMAYSSAGACPSTHPVPVPQIVLNVRWATGGGSLSGVAFSSGDASTLHADAFVAWDTARLNELVTNCLNTGTKCKALRSR